MIQLDCRAITHIHSDSLLKTNLPTCLAPVIKSASLPKSIHALICFDVFLYNIVMPSQLIFQLLSRSQYAVQF